MIETLKRAAWFVWDFLIPRFITEDVALRYVGDEFTTDWREWDSFELVCSMADVYPAERFDGIAQANSFTWLGFGATYRVSNFRPWPGAARHG